MNLSLNKKIGIPKKKIHQLTGSSAWKKVLSIIYYYFYFPSESLNYIDIENIIYIIYYLNLNLHRLYHIFICIVEVEVAVEVEVRSKVVAVSRLFVFCPKLSAVRNLKSLLDKKNEKCMKMSRQFNN